VVWSRFEETSGQYRIVDEGHDGADPISMGCAGKCSLSFVEQVVETIQSQGHDVDWRDAIHLPSNHGTQIWSLDVIRSLPVPPRLFGRIAALHACSDLFVEGSLPCHSAMILGSGRHNTVAQTLDMVEGAAATFAEIDVNLGGGHSFQTHEPELGFAVLGRSPSEQTGPNLPIAGDIVAVSKPIGSGLMMNALTSGDAEKTWEQHLLNVLCAPNDLALALFGDSMVRKMTDVTGFGLLYGVEQLLFGRGEGCTLNFDAVPTFSGWERYAMEGYFSPLAHSNAVGTNRRWTSTLKTWQQLLLNDPQTNGAILFIADSNFDKTKYPNAEIWTIGQITESGLVIR
jgi:selenide,water dikinase